MKNNLLRRFTIEWGHFQEMGENLQRLMLSYAFYLMARPLLDIFMSTFLWRQENGVLLIILYYLGWVLGLPIGFLFNGYLLKRVHVKNLYFFGIVFQGFGAALAIFSNNLTPFSILAYGLLFGITASFFWGNKNSLSYMLSRGKNRLYYNSIESSMRLIIAVVVPLIVGWFLVFSERLPFYSINSAYRIMIVLALVLLAIGGFIMRASNFDDIGTAKLFVTKKSKNWSMVRLSNLIYSSLFGVNLFYPALIILYFGAKEGMFGTIQSAMQLLAAASLYIVARKMKNRHVIRFMNLTHILYLLGFILFTWKFSLVFGLIYLLILIMLETVRWNSSYTLIMGAMDRELKTQDSSADYAYVFDNEIFFNIGRTVGLISFLIVMKLFSLEVAMIWVPPVFILIQFLMVIPMKYLIDHQVEE